MTGKNLFMKGLEGKQSRSARSEPSTGGPSLTPPLLCAVARGEWGFRCKPLGTSSGRVQRDAGWHRGRTKWGERHTGDTGHLSPLPAGWRGVADAGTAPPPCPAHHLGLKWQPPGRSLLTLLLPGLWLSTCLAWALERADHPADPTSWPGRNGNFLRSYHHSRISKSRALGVVWSQEVAVQWSGWKPLQLSLAALEQALWGRGSFIHQLGVSCRPVP